MRNQQRRKKSAVLLIVVAVVLGVVTWFASSHAQPQSVNGFWAAATFNNDGGATVHETIDYHFQTKLHGIHRTIPGVSPAEANQIEVTGGQSLVTPFGSGVQVRIGDPNTKISGNHRYTVTYPLARTELPDGQIAWNGVGASGTVPIYHAELDLVAPWKWRTPSCDVGTTGSAGDCSVTQVSPGHLTVSYGHLDAGEGITIYAQRGTPLAATPTPRTPHTFNVSLPWWRQPINLAIGAFVLALIAAFITARLLRHAGRDWVMAGAASTGNAADAAYGPISGEGVPAGAVRVDDTRLAEWTTTAFAPPKGIKAWQGGVLVDEEVRDRQRVAWILGTAVDGYVDLDDSDPKAMVLHAKPHTEDDTTALLEVAFAGRDSVQLGSYDPHFSAMWASLAARQQNWLSQSGFADAKREGRVATARMLGFVGAVAGLVALVAGAIATFSSGAGTFGVGVGALLAGLGVALVTRSWELHVRTPAGSAMWIRVASFRRFLHNSEAHHVEEAAKRGVLREYTAWAVALDEVDRWSGAVRDAGLPESTPGLNTALMAGMFYGMFAMAGTAPQATGGFGGGGFGAGFGGGMGVGGGFGGGGIGGW